MKDHAPIKRHKALISLSKDHHFGLLLVWKIRQGLRTAVDPKRISRYVLYFFDVDLQQHFMEEENELFNKAPAGDDLCVQALAEHKKVYALIDKIIQFPGDTEILREFADTLEAHIRFEERQLFNHLQDILPEKVLEAHASKPVTKEEDPDNNWDDRFWEK
ncbi:MAG TPA: hemerythrin domain-containing protein [Chitinophagaceae bacterium]